MRAKRNNTLIKRSSDYKLLIIIIKMMFFKPQVFAMMKPVRMIQLAPLLQMQYRPFVKSMEERKEE